MRRRRLACTLLCKRLRKRCISANRILSKQFSKPLRFGVADEAISGCGGVADPRIGPFYCPDNMTVYYSVSFTDRSGQRPWQIGDFALAFILAHELGHHVQKQVGTLDAGLFTIQEELQADCFAGVWGRLIFEQGALEEGALGEAVEQLANIADLPGTPWDDPGAHGTESQRIDAFLTGYDTGCARRCTFWGGY